MSDPATIAAAGTQVPDAGEIFLDHAGWFVSDMDRAAAAFERLGFELTPYSVHGDRDPETGEHRLVGSANRLAMLELGYLEILTPIAGTDTPVSRHMRASLAEHEGVHLAAFTVADAESEAGLLADRGFSVMPTVHLHRTVETAGGGTGEVAFTVIRADLGSVPEGRLQTLTHHTPALMWQPRHGAGDNGFRAFSGLVWASRDPAASAARLARYTNRHAREMAGGWEIALERGRLFILDRADAETRYGPGLPGADPAVVAVLFQGSVAQACDRLAAAGVAVRRESAAHLIVPPAEAVGVALVLHDQAA